MQPSVLNGSGEIARSAESEIGAQAGQEQNSARDRAASMAAIETADRSALQAMTALWITVLGHSRFTAADSFFQVGGDSLRACRLLLLIEQELGVRIAPSRFRGRSTLRQAAGMLGEQARWQPLPPAATDLPQIVSLSAPGRKSPLFLVHPISGSAEIYNPLVESMGLDRACYGIHAPARPAIDSSYTIEGIASAYLQAARALLPAGGRAVLAGYSLGGTIAYEMARQLAESGGAALPVVLIDCESGLPRSRFRVLADLILTLPGWLRHVAPKTGRKALLARGLRRIRGMLASGPILPNLEKEEALAGRDPLPARAMRLMMAALDRYAARPYAGQVVLLRAKHQGLFSRRDPALGWSGLVPNLQVDTIPGSHAVCLWRENAVPAAEILRRHFNSFD